MDELISQNEKVNVSDENNLGVDKEIETETTQDTEQNVDNENILPESSFEAETTQDTEQNIDDESVLPENSFEAETTQDTEQNRDNESVLPENSFEAENVEETKQPLDIVDKLFEGQNQLLDRVETLSKLFNAKIMHTEHEEKIVDKMHKELQTYKNDMYSQLIKPILIDIIEIRDSIIKMSNLYLEKPEEQQNIPNKMFLDYSLDLQDILEKNEVGMYKSEIGDLFTPIKHKVIKKIDSEDKELHGKIAESFSSGYSYNSRVISAEKVAVYYYKNS